jgi:hypothetical protein
MTPFGRSIREVVESFLAQPAVFFNEHEVHADLLVRLRAAVPPVAVGPSSARIQVPRVHLEYPANFAWTGSELETCAANVMKPCAKTIDVRPDYERGMSEFNELAASDQSEVREAAGDKGKTRGSFDLVVLAEDPLRALLTDTAEEDPLGRGDLAANRVRQHESQDHLELVVEMKFVNTYDNSFATSVAGDTLKLVTSRQWAAKNGGTAPRCVNLVLCNRPYGRRETRTDGKRTAAVERAKLAVRHSPKSILAIFARADVTEAGMALQDVTTNQGTEDWGEAIDSYFRQGPSLGVIGAPPIGTAAATKRLAAVMRSLAKGKTADLDKHKSNESDLDREDFVWHYLLSSFATWGGSRGWDGLIANKENYSRVTYAALSALDPKDRVREVEETLRAASVRYPVSKAEQLVDNLSLIDDLGGLAEARKRLLGASGREGKLAFLKRFKGIGPKYARNIMMDVYHPEFRDSIAVDSRIQRISRELGLSFQSYETEEAFYCRVASQAGLNAWEVDRLLYWFTDEVLEAFQASAP